MLSLESILCPCCNCPVDLDAKRADPGKQGRLTCPWCGNRLLLSSADPSTHGRGEIDPDFEERSFGALRLIIHPEGTKVCPQCARVYPDSLECCPDLVLFAIEWYYGPSDRLGPVSRKRIVDFLRQRRRSVAAAIETVRAQWHIGSNADLPVHWIDNMAQELET